VLILLPASERKTPVARGEPLDLARLSFPSLSPTREAVLDALAEVSAEPDANQRLGVPASLSDAVLGNVTLRTAPTAPVATVYAGPLYDGLAASELDAASRRRARTWIAVISALWGAVRLSDRIPSYRLNMCGRLPGLAHLPDVWREPLGGVLPGAARRGLIIDCRSAEYATAWRPAGELAERTVIVKLRAASYDAKHLRGLLARRIVTDAIDPAEPTELTDALSDHFKLELVPPDRPGRAWGLQLIAALT
jgi:cytoplasmic iron level regulating protein YaaA (DUF328/UPF0246 family)